MTEISLEKLTLNITDGKHGDCEEQKNSGFYFISCKDIKDDQINYSNARQITEKDFRDAHKRTMLEPNDILITNSGTIGRMAFIKDVSQTYRTTFQKSVAIIKPDSKKVLPLYLFYQLKNCITILINQSNGSAQKNLLLSTMRNFKIYIHEKKETQEKIVDILSYYDLSIENNQKQIKLLEEAAQRLYKEWFVDLRFPGYENTPVVDGMPEGWEEQSLSQFTEVVMGQSPKSEYFNLKREGLPFHQGVGSYGKRFVIHDTYSTSLTRIAQSGSLLFSVRAPVGRLNITNDKIIIGRGLAALNHRRKLQSYLYYLLKERFYKDNMIGNGSIFASISKAELLNQRFLIPTENLVKRFNDIAVIFDKKIEKISGQIQLLIEIRDRLLPKLMNGELEV